MGLICFCLSFSTTGNKSLKAENDLTRLDTTKKGCPIQRLTELDRIYSIRSDPF